MQIERIFVDGIKVPEGRRDCNAKAVASLAESMKKVGQLQPIIVQYVNNEALLIAGRHRLQAAIDLGWECIDAVFIDGDAIDLELREIAENLHRADLTVQERADQVARWVELIEQKDRLVKPAQVAQVSVGGRGKTGGDSKAARDLGLDRDEVRRAKKISSIAMEAKEAARAAGIDDNQSKLLAIAKEKTAEAQVAKVVSFTKAKEQQAADDHEVSAKWRRSFEKIWNRGSAEDRDWARAWIDKPLMDSRFGHG